MFAESPSVYGIVTHCRNISTLSSWQVSTAVLSITAKAKKKEKEKKEKEEEKMEVVSENFSLKTFPSITKSFFLVKLLNHLFDY